MWDVGLTIAYLKIRMNGRQSDVRAGCVDKCATAQHAIDEQNNLKFDLVGILVFEMLHIERHRAMNRKTDTDHFRGNYTAIMEKIGDATAQLLGHW